MIALWVACATMGSPETGPLPGPSLVDEAYVLLHSSDPIFQAPSADAHRGRLGVARKVDFPAELWPARVLAEQPGWLLVRPVAAARAAAHWSDPPAVLQALGLEVWVQDGQPIPVVASPVIQSWLDGSTIALSPGTPLNGGKALIRAGEATLAVVANPGIEERGYRYMPSRLTATRRPVGWLAVDQALGFGTVGAVQLARVPRAGRSRPATRIPLEEQAAGDTHHWGIVGSRTARVRTVLDPRLIHDGPGWSHAITRSQPSDGYDGWWVVAAGAAVTWADGSPAGNVRHLLRFDVEPATEGDRVCTWWQDLAGAHEPAGVTARWNVHANVLGETGLKLCFPAAAVDHAG